MRSKALIGKTQEIKYRFYWRFFNTIYAFELFLKALELLQATPVLFSIVSVAILVQYYWANIAKLAIRLLNNIYVSILRWYLHLNNYIIDILYYRYFISYIDHIKDFNKRYLSVTKWVYKVLERRTKYFFIVMPPQLRFRQAREAWTCSREIKLT